MLKVTHVSIKVSEGGHNLVSIDEFIDIPYDTRMKLLATHSLTFLDESGNAIPLVDGVKYAADRLRNRKASAS